jgi:hypothetical protein
MREGTIFKSTWRVIKASSGKNGQHPSVSTRYVLCGAGKSFLASQANRVAPHNCGTAEHVRYWGMQKETERLRPELELVLSQCPKDKTGQRLAARARAWALSARSIPDLEAAVESARQNAEKGYERRAVVDGEWAGWREWDEGIEWRYKKGNGWTHHCQARRVKNRRSRHDFTLIERSVQGKEGQDPATKNQTEGKKK